MRRTDHAEFRQLDIYLRLGFPYIEHGLQVFALQQDVAQGGVIHHRAAGGIDQPGAGPESPQPLAIQQVPGRQRPGTDQGRVQADHVALLDDLLQVDIIAAFGRLARWVADQHLPAQAAQDLDQAPADFAGPDHAIGASGQFGALDLGQGQQAAQHVVDHAAGVAAGRAGPVDAGFLEVVQVQVIGTDGAGADKPHCAAFEQFAADRSHRAHQQHIRPGHRRAIDGAPRQAADLAETGKKGIDQGDILVGNNQHGRLLSRTRSVAQIASRGQSAIGPGYRKPITNALQEEIS